MKNHFAQFYPPTPDELGKLWSDGLIVLDANVMLHLYGYSEATKDKVLELYGAVKDRLWVPHQAAAEYHRRRINVIIDQANCYQSAVRDLESLGNRFKSDSQHPFAASPLLKEFDDISGRLTESLNASRDQQLQLLSSDPILHKLTDLLDGCVGDAFSETELSDICKEGATRFEARIPPGFRDKDKPEPDRYGDLIIWKELLRKAAAEKKGVLLIIDDAKEDWFDKRNGRTIGPRVELREEFIKASGQRIHLYNAFRFVEVASDYGISVAVPEAVKEELKKGQRVRDAAARLATKRLTDKKKRRRHLLSSWADGLLKEVDDLPVYDQSSLTELEQMKTAIEVERAEVTSHIESLRKQYGIALRELASSEGHEPVDWLERRRAEINAIQSEIGDLRRAGARLSKHIERINMRQSAVFHDRMREDVQRHLDLREDRGDPDAPSD